METKPFNLQSPESIAKDYGGNKQKIAEAMQMGVLDPTAGTLAGMFIDRMRSAQMQEQAPQQTVAQQVFNPQPPAPPPQPPGGVPGGDAAGLGPPQMPGAPPPAGLGATPEAAQMGMGAPPAPPPEMQMPQGMAGGGLAGLPVPDAMFDEPDNGGYAGGGLVAFAKAGEVKTPKEKTYQEKAAEINKWDPEAFRTRMADIEGLVPKEDTYSKKQKEYYEKEMSPEAMEARRKQDMWMSLAQIGSKMAQTPGSLLQATSAGIEEALPGAQAAAKERRQDIRAAVDALAAQEGASNKERRELLSMSMAAQNAYQQAMMQGLGHDVSVQVAREKNATDLAQTRMTVGASMANARTAAGASTAALTAADRQARTQAYTLAADALKNNRPYIELRQKGDPAADNILAATATRLYNAMGGSTPLGDVSGAAGAINFSDLK